MAKPNLAAFHAAAYPAIALASLDEDRTLREIFQAFPQQHIYVIAASGGLRKVSQDQHGEIVLIAAEPKATTSKMDYPAAFALISSESQSPPTIAVQRDERGQAVGNAILVVLDWHHICKNANAYRALRHAFPGLMALGNMVIGVAPSWALPAELSSDMPVIDMPLPDRAELETALDLCARGAQSPVSAADKPSILDSLSGLTLGQAKNACSLAFAERGSFAADRVLMEKMRAVKQGGFLEWYQPQGVESLGGLGELKRFVYEEVLPASNDIQLAVRGVLITGISGTGKTHAVKVIGSILGYPVLRCDVSGLQGSLVGQTEANLNATLKLIEAVAPCIFFIDEVEKSTAGHDAQGDNGVKSGMVGILLTWLQEHQSRILTVMTCNNYNRLPVELTRPGRIDERIFVDLPTDAERVDVAGIKLRQFGCPIELAEYVGSVTQGFTGAEVEALVKSAARRSGRRPTTELLLTCSREIKPISRVKADEVNAMREWGRANLRLANSEETETIHSGRAIRSLAS